MPGAEMNISPRHLLRLMFGLFVFGANVAWADGSLTHLSGSVTVQKGDGKPVAGRVGTKVDSGDTVVTGTGAYARMQMSDGGEMVLRPDSQLKVESYKYVEAKPAEDNFVFRMLKGGLRTVTGLIGKRGNRDAYSLRTATATVGIRGTQFDLRVCAGNCGALADGTYLAVRFGAVQTSNELGTLEVKAGQVVFVPLSSAPQVLPRDPGIGFTPPAAFPKIDEKKKLEAAGSGQPPGGGQGPGSSSQGGSGSQGPGGDQSADGGGLDCSVE
ncbi:MAG: FecR family protein [Casimicrobiaceae bacterium]